VNGDPETCVRAPVAGFTWNIERLLDVLFPAAANKLPYSTGEKAIPTGPVPVVKGDPDTAVRTPVEVLTENTETLVVLKFATA
jgi:hypothetical protein